MKNINLQNIEYYLNAIVLGCIAPIGYFAPIGEWLLMALLALFSLIKFLLNPYKLNYNYIILFIIICLVLSSSSFYSINPSRTLEVIMPNIGIIFSVFIIVIISSKNNIINIIKILTASTFITAAIIFCDLLMNAEIRHTLAAFVGDDPTSISGNYSRGLLILAALFPIIFALLYESKKYFYAVLILLLVSTIILIGPNNTAKIALICSFIAAIIIYFLGPKSFVSFGIVSALFILFSPIIASNILPIIGKFEEYKACDNLEKVSKINLCSQSMNWQKMPSSNSIIHRLLVWEFVGKQILNKPILGHGLGTSRLIGQDVMLKVPNTDIKIKGGIPLHPHNNFLEVWLELGILGILIISYIWFKIVKYAYYIRCQSYIIGTGLCASIVSMFIICNLSFGFFHAWWMSSVALIFLMLIQSCKYKYKALI